MKPILKPSFKQHLAWQILQDKETSILFYGGAAGGGKSWLGCEWLITNSYFYPRSKSFIARKELKRLMTTTYVTFRKVLAFHKIPDSDFHLDAKYNIITNMETGSRIDLLDAAFKPADDPLFERFGGLEYTFGWSEEAPELKYLAYETLNSRIGRHMNKEFGLFPAKHLLTGNPSKGWPYKMFYRPWKDKTLPSEYGFIQSLFSDNPWTAEEYGKQLSLIRDKAQRERLMKGNWEFDDDPSALMEYDAIIDMFSLPREKSGDRYLIVDAARFGNDRIVMSVWIGLSVVKVVIRRKQSLATTEEDMHTLMDQFGIPRSRVMVDEDGVGGGIVDHIKGIKGFVANSRPIVDKEETDMDGVPKKPNYRNLKAQCAYLLSDYVNNRMISASGRSEKMQMEIIEEIEQIKAKSVDKDAPLDLMPKEEVKEAIGRSPDIGDTFIMRMWFELKKERPFQAPQSASPSWTNTRWAKKHSLSTGIVLPHSGL